MEKFNKKFNFQIIKEVLNNNTNEKFSWCIESEKFYNNNFAIYENGFYTFDLYLISISNENGENIEILESIENDLGNLIDSINKLNNDLT